MPDTTTTNFAFTLTEVGASKNSWGTKLNANWTSLDALLALRALKATTLSVSDGITGGGDLSANRSFALTGQALALHNLATSGMIARTGAGTVAARTITASTGISVANGDGIAADPTISISSDVATLSGVQTFSGAKTFSSALALAVGSAAAPSFGFVGETNTGTFRPAAAAVGWTVAGVERMRLTGAGQGLRLIGDTTNAIISLDTRNSGWNARDVQLRTLETGGVNQAGLQVLVPNGSPPVVKFQIDHVGNVTLPTAGETKSLIIGNSRTGNANSIIDLIGDTTYTSYGLRITRNGGPNGGSTIQQRGTGDFIIAADDAAKVRFRTNNADALTITSGQAIGFQNQSPQGLWEIDDIEQSLTTKRGLAFTSHDSDNVYRLTIQNKGAALTSTVTWDQLRGATPVLRFYANGDIYNLNGVYGTISDERLKSILGSASEQWEDSKAVDYIQYQLKSDIEQDGAERAPVLFGVSAQQLQSAGLGGLVSPGPDGTLRVKSSVFFMKIAKVVQEAQRRIEALEAKLSEREAA